MVEDRSMTAWVPSINYVLVISLVGWSTNNTNFMSFVLPYRKRIMFEFGFLLTFGQP